MRNFIKRLTATILLICTLMSFVVPATYADTPAGNVPTVYDFDLGNSTDPVISQYNLVDKLSRVLNYANGTTTGKTGWKLLEEMYADPSCSLNWKGEAFGKSTNQSKIVSDKNGLYLYTGGDAVTGYLVLRLAAPKTGAGTYNVSLTSTDARNTIDVYLLDAADYTTPEAAMTSDNKIFTGLVTNETHTTIAPVTVDGGEMILVFNTTNAVSKDRHVVSNITLTPVAGGDVPATTTAPVATTTEATTAETTVNPTETTSETTVPGDDTGMLFPDGIYDFELYNYDRYKPMIGAKTTFALSKGAEGALAGVYTQGQESREILAADYPAVLNWKVEGIDSSMSYANLTLYASANTGMRIQKAATNQPETGWIAFRIEVPQGAKYDLNAITESSWVAHSVYVFPADAGTMSESALEEKMTAENRVGKPAATSNHTAEAPYFETYRNVDFTAGGEYIVVFKMDATASKSTIYLSGLALTPPSGEEDPTEPSTEPEEPVELIPGGPVQENIFDMELYRYEVFKNMAGTDTQYTKGYNGSQTVAQYMDANYPENINWNIEGYAQDGAVLFHGAKGYGMRAEIGANNYIAFRVNISKAANYNVIFRSTYTLYEYNATAYLVPAPESKMTPEQITAAITEDNKLGTYSHTYKIQSAAILDQKVEAAGGGLGQGGNLDAVHAGKQVAGEEVDGVEGGDHGLRRGQRGRHHQRRENENNKFLHEIPSIYRM